MENREIVLTVIVTIYNVASYLDMCIESIIGQTYNNLDIILIDDGSTDGSSDICDRYANTDGRIRVVHKKNEGLVSARCQGVRLAKGKLVSFVDGDDWIDWNMYECMIAVYLENFADLVTSGMFWEWKDKKKLMLDDIAEGLYEGKAIQNSIFTRLMSDFKTGKQGITASVCNKLFERSLLNKVIESIDPHITLGEDGAITYYFVVYAKKIQVINRSWYHYRQHENSMRITYGLNAFEKIDKLQKCLLTNFKTVGLECKMKEQVSSYIKGFLLGAVRDVYGINLGIISYLFPYEKVPKNSKVILYGAGVVGQSYWSCLKKREYVDIIAWVDKNYKKLQMSGLPVESIEGALNKKYDYIIIAIEKGKVASEIRRMLLDRGVEKQKIVWDWEYKEAYR